VRWLHKLRLRLRSLVSRAQVERDLDVELRFLLDSQIEENLAAGMNPEEARHAALRSIGGLAHMAEQCRDMRRVNFLADLAQDLRYAGRMLARSPGFTAVAVVSLALGIGANTAIYSFLEAVLMRSLPVHDPDSLVTLNWHTKSRVRAGRPTVIKHGNVNYYPDNTGPTLPFPAFELFRTDSPVFSSVFAYSDSGPLTLIVHGEAGVARAQYVSGEFFRCLGVTPAAGRPIDPGDDQAGATPVAVASYRLWQNRFGGTPNIAGQSILVDNTAFAVVGVTPAGFYGPGSFNAGMEPDRYLPLHTSTLLDASYPAVPWNDKFSDKNNYWVEIMGRLRPGVGIGQAQAVLGPVFQRFAAGTASNDKEKADLPALVLQPSARGFEALRLTYAQPIYVLMAMVGLILVLACANLANLLLARATTRRREIAVRLSLGAGRLRILRQLLTESVLLASMGGALGIVVAVWGIRSLTLLLANGRDGFTLHAGLNWHVLAVTILLSILTGLLFGLAPAVQATRVDVTPALKESRLGKSHARVNLSQFLVVAQMAISLLLVTGAGLFVRTVSNLEGMVAGIDRDQVLLLTVNAKQGGFKDDSLVRFYAGLQTRLAGIPGVRNVSLSNVAPLLGGFLPFRVAVPGAPVDQPGVWAIAGLLVGHSYFPTMQLPLLRGRGIDEGDTLGARPVGVVNEEFVKTYLSGGNPIGRHFQLISPVAGVDPTDIEIVGVSRNSRELGSLRRAILPTVYIPYSRGQQYLTSMVYEVRTAGDPRSLVPTVRQLVRQAGARIPVTGVKTLAEQGDQAINQERILAMLSAAVAILAMAIASVGIYGTVAYGVARRTNEIGIRMALGAQRQHVVWMVLREVIALSIAGIAIGLPVAFGASHLVQSLLFAVKPNDPVALTLAVAILFGSAALAAFAPARRASRIDPMAALRHE